MSYYHYTSLDALNGILQPKEFGKKELCFGRHDMIALKMKKNIG